MRVYIRHGHKAYKNGKPSRFETYGYPKVYLHDPPLTRRGVIEAEYLAERLIELYGPPDVIITSPYLRARETAASMAGVVIEASHPVRLVCCNDVAEYLGNHGSATLDVESTTEEYNPPHPETFHAFRCRVNRHAETWSSRDVTWIITHGIVINEILRPYYPKYPIPYLGYIVIPDLGCRPDLYLDPNQDRPVTSAQTT